MTNKEKLEKSLREEHKIYSHYITMDINIFNNYVQELINEISKIPFNDALIEYGPFNHVSFKLRMSDGIMINLSHYLDLEIDEIKYNDAFYVLLENRNIIGADCVNLNIFVEDIIDSFK